MNECEQIHPLLRGYLGNALSARERRLVARHLNLCASARKELDRFRSGPIRAPEVSANPPSETWDFKILRWFFKTAKIKPKIDLKPRLPIQEDQTLMPVEFAEEQPQEEPMEKLTEVQPEQPLVSLEEQLALRQAFQPAVLPEIKPTGQAPVPAVPHRSTFKFIFYIVVFFLVLALLTHFIQNASDNSMVRGVKHWMAKRGYHILGVRPTLELVVDLTNFPHWSGDVAPVAFPYQELVTDLEHFKIYWQILQPGIPLPSIDFSKDSLAIVFLGLQKTGGYEAKFKRSETYTNKTVYWFDEVAPSGGEAPNASARPWIIQQVPKPAQVPGEIQKVQ
jgi:hypothetical protein